MRATWETLPKHESDHNALGKYSHQNNIILSGNADCFRWYLSVLADIDVYMECQDVESYHRSGKADTQKFKKIIVQLVNRKNCIKVLSHKKKFGKIDCRNPNFSNSTKIFAIQNFTTMNEMIAHNYW